MHSVYDLLLKDEVIEVVKTNVPVFVTLKIILLFIQETFTVLPLPTPPSVETYFFYKMITFAAKGLYVDGGGGGSTKTKPYAMFIESDFLPS